MRLSLAMQIPRAQIIRILIRLTKNWVFMLLVSVIQIKPHYFYAKRRKIERTRGDAEMFYKDYLWVR